MEKDTLLSSLHSQLSICKAKRDYLFKVDAQKNKNICGMLQAEQVEIERQINELEAFNNKFFLSNNKYPTPF